MPTYEYVCAACGHGFEQFQKMSAAPVKVCPECGKRSVKRLISSGGGVVFKGPGFYATDYRKGSPPSPEKKPASEEKSAGTTTKKSGDE